MTREELLANGWVRWSVWLVRGSQTMLWGRRREGYCYAVATRENEPRQLIARSETMEEALRELGEYTFVDGTTVREWALKPVG